MIISSSFSYLFFHWHCFNVSLFHQCSIVVLCCSTLFPLFCIRGHKGQNSIETQCCDFLALESRCCGFLCSEKMLWNHDAVVYLSLFLDVVVFWSWNLDVVIFWSWNLDDVVFWSWNLDVVVYVPPGPFFRYHCENKKNHI